MSTLSAALDNIANGISVIPIVIGEKRPALPSWKDYQSRLATEEECAGWFPAHNIGLVCGNISENLELIDLDNEGEQYDDLKALVDQALPGLWEKLVIEKTPSGGFHLVYRCRDVVIPGNTKLAARGIECPDNQDLKYKGKTIRPRQVNGKWYAVIGLIETRGEGGQFLAAPNAGYNLLQNDYQHVPVISADERETLINSARALNEWHQQAELKPTPAPAPAPAKSTQTDESPADEYNSRCDLHELISAHGWTKFFERGNKVYYSRPGKTKCTSGSVIDNTVFYNFSSNGAPFEPEKGYSKFQCFALLEHGGDEKKAAISILKLRPPKKSDQFPSLGSGDSASAEDDYSAELEPLDLDELMSMDVANDPTCLLGKRFLCQGGSLMIVGQSGIGKSSITTQAAFSWCLGLDFFGITPKRPLKSLIIQNENDKGDLAEGIQGVINGMKYGSEDKKRLKEGVIFLPQNHRTAEKFTMFLRRAVERHRSELVFIDPLLGFLGGDVSNQEICGKFLRDQLNPIAQAYGCAFVIVHHTGKPPKDPNRNQTTGDLAYLGIGSSDLTNWARAIMVLRELEEGLFELRAAKRGPRSGLRIYRNSEETGILTYLIHSKEGICWDYANRLPNQDELDSQALDVDGIISKIPREGLVHNDILDIIMNILGTKSRVTANQFFNKYVKPRLFFIDMNKKFRPI